MGSRIPSFQLQTRVSPFGGSFHDRGKFNVTQFGMRATKYRSEEETATPMASESGADRCPPFRMLAIREHRNLGMNHELQVNVMREFQHLD